MPEYKAPIRDMKFVMQELFDCDGHYQRLGYEDASLDMIDAIIAEAAKFTEQVVAPINQSGDEQGCTWKDGNVTTPDGFKEAYQQYVEGGWPTLAQNVDFGGQGLPHSLNTAITEFFSSANHSFAMYPGLSHGALATIEAHGTDNQKNIFMPKLVEGSWTGTMCLTEPHCGTDLGMLRTKAEINDDGSYSLTGTKIFISAGEHDLSDNIVHIVIARIPGSPEGSRGISLFIVPKILLNADGSLGDKNDVTLSGLLHKMGCRNATSTALSFGDKEGAVGYLIGQPHQGLNYMFQMMNDLRVGVGLGAAVLANRAYLYSLDYARERPQGRLASAKDPLSKQVRIIEHADVRRMLLAQKTYSEGSMALCLYAASLVEDCQTASTDKDKQRASALLDLLTPIVKSYPSKYGCVSNDLAIQILGGAGYIREHPVEQLYRDQRLNPIHEGTEGIHGLDLLGRKVRAKKQHDYLLFKEEVQKTLRTAFTIETLAKHAESIDQALHYLDEVTDSLSVVIQHDPDRGLANATVYLDMFGRIVMAWIWLKQAIVATQQLHAGGSDLADSQKHFYQGKLQAMRYCIEWELPQTVQQAELLIANNATCFEMRDDYF